jgi:hypothetical protein
MLIHQIMQRKVLKYSSRAEPSLFHQLVEWASRAEPSSFRHRSAPSRAEPSSARLVSSPRRRPPGVYMYMWVDLARHGTSPSKHGPQRHNPNYGSCRASTWDEPAAHDTTHNYLCVSGRPKKPKMS